MKHLNILNWLLWRKQKCLLSKSIACIHLEINMNILLETKKEKCVKYSSPQS